MANDRQSPTLHYHQTRILNGYIPLTNGTRLLHLELTKVTTKQHHTPDYDARHLLRKKLREVDEQF